MRSLLRKKRNTKKYYKKQRGGNFNVEQTNALRNALVSLQFEDETTLTTEEIDNIITKIQTISQPFSADFDQILQQLSAPFQNKTELMEWVDGFVALMEGDIGTDNETNSDIETDNSDMDGGRTKKYRKHKKRKTRRKRQSRKRQSRKKTHRKKRY